MPSAGPILVDTNTILECHRTGCWAALAGTWTLETVEECIIETQTGGIYRAAESRLDEALLRSAFKVIHPVTQLELAEVALMGGPHLDSGERALWAHAIGRKDGWRLCGPDRASMKFGVQIGLKDRLVSLQALVEATGARPSPPMKAHFDEAWLRKTVTTIMMGGL